MSESMSGMSPEQPSQKVGLEEIRRYFKDREVVVEMGEGSEDEDIYDDRMIHLSQALEKGDYAPVIEYFEQQVASYQKTINSGKVGENVPMWENMKKEAEDMIEVLKMQSK